MAKLITRSFSTSKVTAQIVAMKDGKIMPTDLPPIVMEGEVSEETAMKKLQGIHGRTKSIIIVSIDVTSKLMGIPADVFLLHAKEIKPSEKTEQTN